MEKKLIIKGHEKNPFVKFWNWGWGIYYKNPEIWNYLIVGFLTTVVSLAIKWSLLFTILDAKDALQVQIAVIISWIGAVGFAYVTNRIFVFKSKSKNYFKEIRDFVISRIATLLMEMTIMWIFVTLLKLNSDNWVLVFTIICQIVVTVFNYIFSKLFVFKAKKN